jgi:hypothetical protein
MTLHFLHAFVKPNQILNSEILGSKTNRNENMTTVWVKIVLNQGTIRNPEVNSSLLLGSS